MSGKHKKKGVPAAAATAAAPPAPAVASTPDAKAGGRRGAIVVAALVAMAVLTLALVRTPGSVSSAEADPAPISELAGFRADAWYLPDDAQLGFVEVPEGLFLMGSDPADPLAYPNERWADGTGPASVHEQTFYVARYEVTVAQFRAFVEATEYRASMESLAGEPDHPVTGVSWTDAIAYARWLEEQMKDSPTTPQQIAQLLGDGWHLTLPTEVQWEKAARGTDARAYPWGAEPRADRANFQSSAPRKVGSFDCPECPYGLSDMSGNVWELTRTPFRDAPYNPSSPVDLGADALWVMRGGSFGDPPRNVRTAIRGGVDPGARRPIIGFRLVISK